MHACRSAFLRGCLTFPIPDTRIQQCEHILICGFACHDPALFQVESRSLCAFLDAHEQYSSPKHSSRQVCRLMGGYDSGWIFISRD